VLEAARRFWGIADWRLPIGDTRHASLSVEKRQSRQSPICDLRMTLEKADRISEINNRKWFNL
jgi:hypothetical protein